jgi:hypothetical protein
MQMSWDCWFNICSSYCLVCLSPFLWSLKLCFLSSIIPASYHPCLSPFLWSLKLCFLSSIIPASYHPSLYCKSQVKYVCKYVGLGGLQVLATIQHSVGGFGTSLGLEYWHLCTFGGEGVVLGLGAGVGWVASCM